MFVLNDVNYANLFLHIYLCVVHIPVHCCRCPYKVTTDARSEVLLVEEIRTRIS